jgi:hypothetical protein
VLVDSEKAPTGEAHAFSQTYNDNSDECRLPILMPADK